MKYENKKSAVTINLSRTEIKNTLEDLEECLKSGKTNKIAFRFYQLYMRYNRMLNDYIMVENSPHVIDVLRKKDAE